MLISKLVTVYSSHLQCPICRCEDIPWGDSVNDNGITIYYEECPKCETDFAEYCIGEDYLYTTYTEYIRSTSSNARW